MEAKQIQPNHADHISYYKEKYLLDMFQHEVCVVQPKYDGERMLIHIVDGQVFCTSRRLSKKTERFMENQDKLPILQEVLKDFLPRGYTVIDCEAYAKDWSTAVGILHSLPERAIELQKQETLCFAVFDCLFYDGTDLRNEPYFRRLGYAADVVRDAHYLPLHFVNFVMHDFTIGDTGQFLMPEALSDCNKAMTAAIEAGFEGVVVKSLDRAYYDKGASLKCKKFETLDVVICGYQEGRGKYEGSVGAIEIGYYDEDKDSIIKISRVNCGTDEEREYVNQHRQELMLSVIEVKCQEVTDKSLRHPVFIRFRDDKDYKSCTKDTIFK